MRALLVLLAIVSVSPKPYIHTGDKQTNTTQSKKEEKLQGSICPNCTFYQYPQKTHEQEEEDKATNTLYRDYMRWTIIGMVATVVGVVGGLVGLWVIWCQTKATRDAANAAKSSADAAIASVNSIKRIERGWLLITVANGIKQTSFNEGGNTVLRSSYDWSVTNHGKTPAIICGVAPRSRLLTPQEFEAMKHEPANYGSIDKYEHDAVIIGPGRTHQMAAVKIEPQNDPSGRDIPITNGELGFVVYGIIQYRDVFKNSDMHYSKFVSILNPDNTSEFLPLGDFGEYNGHT
jgi:hypothetical protein